jgi:hypothetical protein
MFKKATNHSISRRLQSTIWSEFAASATRSVGSTQGAISAEQLRAAGQLTWMVVDASKQLGDIDLNADTLASWYWLWWCEGTVLTFLEVRKNAPEQVRNAMLCTCADLLRSCIFIPCKLTKQRIMSSL